MLLLSCRPACTILALGPPLEHKMKRRLANRSLPLLCFALLATLTGGRRPDLALADEAPEPPSMLRAARRVHVHRVWCKPGMTSDPQTGMTLCGHLEAVGLRWQSLLVEVRLGTGDGKPVRVVPGAPDGYADEKGHFCMWVRLPVLDDTYEWPELCASFPHETLLDLPPKRPRRLIATFRVSGGGLSSISQAEIAVPPVDAGAKRAVRLLAVDPFPNSMPPHDGAGPAEMAKKADAAAPAETGLGLMVWGYVEAVGLDRSKIAARLTLRDQNGKPLPRRDRKNGGERPFESRAELNVIPDQAQVFSHFVPYSVIGLEPGKHRLVLTYAASCQGLEATAEALYVIPVAAGQPAAKGKPAVSEPVSGRESGLTD